MEELTQYNICFKRETG